MPFTMQPKISYWHVPKFAEMLFNIGENRSNKDYRIGIGFIKKINRSTVQITRSDKNGDYQTIIKISDLDYNYCWLPKMVFGYEYQVCFRYNTAARGPIQSDNAARGPIQSDNAARGPIQSNTAARGSIQQQDIAARGSIQQQDTIFSDIRLCGMCTRISKSNSGIPYGFIKHALFSNNLYFRIIDIDRSPYVNDNVDQISVGDWVAFRVGSQRKSGSGRYWAMRICKL